MSQPIRSKCINHKLPYNITVHILQLVIYYDTQTDMSISDHLLTVNTNGSCSWDNCIYYYLTVYCIVLQDMLCFSGGGMLNIKASSFPVHQQKLQVYNYKWLVLLIPVVLKYLKICLLQYLDNKITNIKSCLF
jgi:hypothetical protein